jgi:hypothetical protein
MERRSEDRASRPATPAAVKRQLRQEAGFGCCNCGVPIIEYHHIVPFAEEAHFRPEDMMVLCPTCHDQANDGAMRVDEQRRLKSAPFNIRRGHADGVLKINQDHLAVDMGILVVADGAFVTFEGDDLLRLSLKDNRLALSVALYDKDDQLRALIDRNEWVSGDPQLWDIEADWQVLVLRYKSSDIALRIVASRDPILLRAKLYRSGARLEITNAGFNWWATPTSKAARLHGDHGCLVGGYLALSRQAGGLTYAPLDEEIGTVVIAESDPLRRLANGLNAHNMMKGGMTGQEIVDRALFNPVGRSITGVHQDSGTMGFP